MCRSSYVKSRRSYAKNLPSRRSFRSVPICINWLGVRQNWRTKPAEMLWSPGSEAPNIVTLSRRLFHHKLWALYHTTCSASKGALQLSTLNRNLRSNHQIRVDRSRSNHSANSIGHSSRMKGLSFSELKHQMLTDIQYVWSTAMRKHVGPFYSFQCWLGSDSCWSNLRISSHRHLFWFVNIILIAPPSSHFHGIKHMLNHHRCNHLSWVAKSFGLPLLCEFPWRSWPLGHFLSLVVKLQTVNLGRDFHSNLIGKKNEKDFDVILYVCYIIICILYMCVCVMIIHYMYICVCVDIFW